MPGKAMKRRLISLQMMKKHREDTDESAKASEDIAHTLLSNSDLPLLIRAHACMILGAASSDDARDWAKEAVRIAEIAQDVDTPGPAEEALLENAQHVLASAEMQYAIAGGDEGAKLRAQEAEDEEEEDEE